MAPDSVFTLFVSADQGPIDGEEKPGEVRRVRCEVRRGEVR